MSLSVNDTFSLRFTLICKHDKRGAVYLCALFTGSDAEVYNEQSARANNRGVYLRNESLTWNEIVSINLYRK